MPNPVACMFRLERSPTLGTAAIDDLVELLSDPEHAGLRRTVALWLTQVLLPSRLPGVTVPKVKKLEEVSPMIAEHAIDWTAQWREEGRKKERRGKKARRRFCSVSSAASSDRSIRPLKTASTAPTRRSFWSGASEY